MAGGHGFVGFVVVFDVIGPQTGAAVTDVHVAVGDGEVALAFLCLGLELGDSSLGRADVDLLPSRGA